MTVHRKQVEDVQPLLVYYTLSCNSQSKNESVKQCVYYSIPRLITECLYIIIDKIKMHFLNDDKQVDQHMFRLKLTCTSTKSMSKVIRKSSEIPSLENKFFRIYFRSYILSFSEIKTVVREFQFFTVFLHLS